MTRAFVWVDGRQIHYRTAGSGAPVVMLHPSPLSSAAVWPVAAAIAEHCRVFALDTPGYGQSEPLTQRPQSLADYLPTLAATLDALGLGKVCLYGCATGAQFAVEFAKVYPQRVALLVLDTAGHISADECAAIVRDYFPDVSAQTDGRHLVTLWQMVRDLFVFFPWCDTRAASRVRRDLPAPTVMQSMLLDYLRAGADYHLAYRPAFYNERADRTQAVTVPAVLTRWEGSIAVRITDALIASGLPANFTVLPLGPMLAQRTAGIAHYIAKHYRAADCGDPGAVSYVSNRLHSSYVAVQSQQLHMRSSLTGGGRPLLVLHDVAGSAALAETLLELHRHKRPVLAVDLPGHGESDGARVDALIGPATDAQTLLQALERIGIDVCDVLTLGSGALTGAALRQSQPSRLHEQRDIAPPQPLPADTPSPPVPDFSPRADGTHLLAAWYWLRDQALWRWPGVTHAAAIRDGEPAPGLRAVSLHQQLVELMKIGPRVALELGAVQAQLRTTGAP